MSKNLLKINLIIPLKYYIYDLYSDKKDSEFVMGLKQDIIWEEYRYIEEPIAEKDQVFKKQENICFHLTCENLDETKNIPKDYFKCEISNIVAHNKEEALKLIKPYMHRICRTVSFLMSKNNCNKHSYQPRVEADFDDIEWQVSLYTPFDNMVNKSDENVETRIVDGKKYQVISLKMEPVSMSVETYIKIYGKMQTDDFLVYKDCEDLNVNYMLDEFYLALGQENVNSKFFHLFSIIEFVEENYKDLSDANRLFDDAEVEAIIKYIDECPELANKEFRESVHNRLKNTLSQITNFGRNKKLLNILHNMNIKKIECCGREFEINIKNISGLTRLRNIFYHGNRDEIEKTTRIIMEQAVLHLLDICERIIEFAIKNEGIGDVF